MRLLKVIFYEFIIDLSYKIKRHITNLLPVMIYSSYVKYNNYWNNFHLIVSILLIIPAFIDIFNITHRKIRRWAYEVKEYEKANTNIM